MTSSLLLICVATTAGLSAAQTAGVSEIALTSGRNYKVARRGWQKTSDEAKQFVEEQGLDLNKEIQKVSVWCGTINKVLGKSIYHCFPEIKFEDGFSIVAEQYSSGGYDGQVSSMKGQSKAGFHVHLFKTKHSNDDVKKATICTHTEWDIFTSDRWRDVTRKNFACDASKTWNPEGCQFATTAGGLLDWIGLYMKTNPTYSMDRQCQNFATGLYNAATGLNTNREQWFLASVAGFFGSMVESSQKLSQSSQLSLERAEQSQEEVCDCECDGKTCDNCPCASPPCDCECDGKTCDNCPCATPPSNGQQEEDGKDLERHHMFNSMLASLED